jgi:hypothetical protein
MRTPTAHPSAKRAINIFKRAWFPLAELFLVMVAGFVEYIIAGGFAVLI